MARVCDLVASLSLYSCLIASAVIWGAHRGWPLAATQVLAFLGFGAALLSMCAERRLTWIPTPLALPLAAFSVLVCLQLVIGNRRLVEWALAPAGAPANLPMPFFVIGSVAPGLTRDSLVLFLAYAAVFFATVHILRSHAAVERLVHVLVGLGAVLAFAGIVDYLHGEPLIVQWRDDPVVTGRLAGTFVNPDHFATWLVMLLFLGIGALLGRRSDPQESDGKRSAQREWLSRGALLFFGLVLIGVAFLLTLSRAALIAAAAGAVTLISALWFRRLVRRNAVIIVALFSATLVYAVWIGLGPLLDRLSVIDTDYASRALQYRASLPMLADFPVLGVGLGAYRDIFPRYQPLALEPGRVYFPYAHNDPLQLVIETGLIGVLIFAWGVVAVARHAHLFLFGAERRHDRWTVTLALGALVACSTALFHAFFDFSIRIPANGVLVAALLGLATVVLQTRFRTEEADVLADVRVLLLGALPRRVLTGALVAALVAGLSTLAVRPALGGATDRRLESRDDYEAALAERPTQRSLHLSLARIALRNRELPTAVAHLDRAIALGPEDAFLRASSAGLLASMAETTSDVTAHEQFLRRGIEEARQAVQRVPSLLPLIVDWYLEIGTPSGQLQALAPPEAFGQLQLAVALERRGMVTDARSAYERAAGAAGPSERALYRRFLAAALARAGDHAGAAVELQSARHLEPESIPVHLMLAGELSSSGDYGQALFYYRAAIGLAEREAAKPRESVRPQPRGLSPRAQVLEGLSVAAFGPEPDQPQEWLFRVQLALALFHMDHGEFTEARPLLEALARRPEANASLQFALGVTYENLGAWDPAAQAFRRAVDLDPSNVTYRLRLAQGLWAREKFFEALDLWRAAADLQPNNPDLQVLVARAYERVGERVEAVRRYRRALDVDPSHAVALRGMAQLTERGRWK